MTTPNALVVSVQVREPRTYEWLSKTLASSIVKHPVDGPLRVEGVNLAGDDQADREQHGGRDKTVYAYATEDEEWWATERGRPLEPGMFGHNVTTRGLDITHAVIGEVWQVGTAVLQVTEPRTPCWKLGMRMGDRRFPRRLAAARRPGAHTRLLRPGVIAAGDAIVVTSRPDHGVTVDAVNRIYFGDDPDASRLLTVPELADHWREWASHRTVWHLDEDAKRGDL